MTEIETDRLLLRRWREKDLDPYARLCADPEVMRYLPGTLTREESARRIERFMHHWERRGYGLWAAEERADGEFIGFVGPEHHDDWPVDEHKVEVGWRLDKRFWEKSLLPKGRWRACATGSNS